MVFESITISFLVGFVVVVTCLPSHFHGVPSPQVETRSGRLRGRFVETRGGRVVQAFFGIPYAKPPVDTLRFQPPQPVDPWLHERLAVTQPRPCAQIIDPRGQEDCLYLNIYTPDVRGEYPVMVFFYGGGFEVGTADGYTAEYFLDHDIVFVVVQYRLGLFGFLSTGDEVVPGNMGLKDQRQSLRWLQKNVHVFGGDRGRVTIYGQSAGAASVHFLMTFSAHEGLFWAGISQSASSLVPWAFHPPEEIRKMVPVLALFSGCPEDSVGLVQCLQTKTVAEILVLYDTKYKGSMYSDVEIITNEFLPLIGGVIEPECVEDRLITGNPWDYNTTTPWLVGTVSKEILFVLTVDLNDRSGTLLGLVNLLFDYFFPLGLNYQNSVADGSFVPLHIREYYLDLLPISRLTLAQIVDGVSDGVFAYGIYEACMRSNTNHTYLYYFDYLPLNEIFPIPYESRVGPSHADDLYLFFPHPAAPFPNRQYYFDEEDNKLSRELVQMWVNFATCLNPTPCGTCNAPCCETGNGTDYRDYTQDETGNGTTCSKKCNVKWEPFFPNRSFLNITDAGVRTEAPFLPNRMQFWTEQPFPYRNDSYVTPPCRSEFTGNTTLLHDSSD